MRIEDREYKYRSCPYNTYETGYRDENDKWISVGFWHSKEQALGHLNDLLKKQEDIIKQQSEKPNPEEDTKQ